MKATGCRDKECGFPNEKDLDLQPFRAYVLKNNEYWFAAQCEWNRYNNAPSTARIYRVCRKHYEIITEAIAEMIVESGQIDSYLTREDRRERASRG